MTRHSMSDLTLKDYGHSRWDSRKDLVERMGKDVVKGEKATDIPTAGPQSEMLGSEIATKSSTYDEACRGSPPL